MSELRGLGVVQEELAKRSGRVLAISVDPPARSAEVVARQKLPFTILSDPEASVIRAYGVLHAGGAPNGGDMALPAQFLIDMQGRIVWRHVAARIPDRPDPAELIAEIAKAFGR